MLLNPFFELFERAEDEYECYDDAESPDISGNEKYLDLLKDRVDSIVGYSEKLF